MEGQYAEIWVLVAALAALFGLPLIEIFYRLEVQARVVMTPLERRNTHVAKAYDAARAKS